MAITAFFISIGLIGGLLVTNMIMIGRNVTRMDLMKGTFRFNDAEGTKPNPFNLTFIANYVALFKHEGWLFWWPSELFHEYDGTSFEMVHPVKEN